MKLSDERKAWLIEQLADKSECQLFNFGESKGFDVHADIVSLLAENEALKGENEALMKEIKRWRVRDGQETLQG